MISLGIHTAGPFCGVAILKDGEIVAEQETAMRRGHDQFLPGIVEETAKTSGVNLMELSSVSVCVGPGSFTGIRIGVAFARGLALSNNVKAIGVSSLEALLGKPPKTNTLVLLPAKIRPPDLTFWAQHFNDEGLSDPIELSAYDVQSYVEGGAKIVANNEAAETLLGILPGVEVERAEAKAAGVPLWASTAAKNVLREPSPLYVRAPDAIPAKSPLL